MMAKFLTELARLQYERRRTLHCWHPGSIPDLNDTQQCCWCGVPRGEWVVVPYGNLHGPHIIPGYGDYRTHVDRSIEACPNRPQHDHGQQLASDLAQLAGG